MINSPCDCKPLVRNKQILDLAKQNIFEVVKFPAYYPDEWVVNEIKNDKRTSVVWCIAVMNGIIPISTIGNFKSFLVDFNRPLANASDSSRA